MGAVKPSNRIPGHHGKVTSSVSTKQKTTVKVPLLEYPPPMLNWEDYCQFAYPEEWTDTLRRHIRHRDEVSCRLCGSRRERLDVHHINYDKTDCDHLNLITLCRTCHQKTNLHRKDYYKMFWYKMRPHLTPSF